MKINKKRKRKNRKKGNNFLKTNSYKKKKSNFLNLSNIFNKWEKKIKIIGPPIKINMIFKKKISISYKGTNFLNL